MSTIDIHYIFGGLTVLIGSIGFIKVFDFLARQSVKRLLELVHKDRN